MDPNSCNKCLEDILLGDGVNLVACFRTANLKLNSSITKIESLKDVSFITGRICVLQVFSDRLYINVFLKFPFHNLLIDDDSCPYRNTFRNKHTFSSTRAGKHIYIRRFDPLIFIWFNQGRNLTLH